jgi:acetyl esterase
MNEISPAVAARLDPQMAAAIQKNDELVAAAGNPADLDDLRRVLASVRRWWNEGGPSIAQVAEVKIAGPRREIPIVIYHPKPGTTLPVFVFLHGGGWKFGNEWANDRQMREITAAWGGVVVSADYAHMPEHVFPVAVHECAALLQTLFAHGARWGIDGNRIAVGGASAGASVSFGAIYQLGGTRTGYIKAGVSIVGSLDTDYESESAREFGNAFVPPINVIRSLGEQYVPRAEDRDDPRFVATAGDASMLPPVFLAAAEMDLRRDSTKNMARRLTAAGTPHTLKIYRGMTHLFFEYTKMVDRAAECTRDVAAFLRERLPAR